MAIFLTGSTGYIGAHIAANLLEGYRDSLNLLIRAKDPHEAEVRLWQALQLHLDFPRFHNHLHTRIKMFRGDLTGPRFGLSDSDYERLVWHDGFGHSLRGFIESEMKKSCLNVNLRGTLEVITDGDAGSHSSRFAAV